VAADAAIVKGMLARGDRQHDIAAWFGVNGGRIAEIATGYRFPLVEPAEAEDLPPPGPYPAGRVAILGTSAAVMLPKPKRSKGHLSATLPTVRICIGKLERAKGFEPSTPTLANLD